MPSVTNLKLPTTEPNMKVIENKLLGGWFIVRGAHQTPISGRFDSKEAALAYLRRRNPLHY